MTDDIYAVFEKTLGVALAGVASDLRLVEAGDFIAFIRIGHIANLRNIVDSSAELHFRPGTLELAELGHAELSWTERPTVVLPMKFVNRGLSAYFRLHLSTYSASVELESLNSDDGSAGDELCSKLSEALADAKCSRDGRS